MSKLFTKAYWIATLELTVVAFVTAFGGSLALANPPAAKSFVAAGVAGGMGALYAFIKQLSSVQTLNRVPPTAPPPVQPPV